MSREGNVGILVCCYIYLSIVLGVGTARCYIFLFFTKFLTDDFYMSEYAWNTFLS